MLFHRQLCSFNSHWCAFLISRNHSITHPYLFREKQVFSFPKRSLGFKTVTSVPEIIETVFAKTSPKRSFSMTEYDRFWLVFTKTRVYKFGHWWLSAIFHSYILENTLCVLNDPKISYLFLNWEKFEKMYLETVIRPKLLPRSHQRGQSFPFLHFGRIFFPERWKYIFSKTFAALQYSCAVFLSLYHVTGRW